MDKPAPDRDASVKSLGIFLEQQGTSNVRSLKELSKDNENQRKNVYLTTIQRSKLITFIPTMCMFMRTCITGNKKCKREMRGPHL